MNKQEGLWMRCPRLGGETPFTYCLVEGGELPCSRIVVCWQPFFPVEQYLQRVLTPQRWQAFVERKPQEKISSLVTLAEKAKKE